MIIKNELTDSHQALLTVELDAAQLERKKQQAARRIARNTHIPGFRPGKAPYPIVARHVGEGRILEDAIEALIDEVYPQIIEQSGITPYGPGSLENLSLDGQPTAQFLVPLAPEVTLGDYHSLRIAYQPPQITDDDVDAAIQRLRDLRATIEEVERPGQEGDLLNIQLTARIEGADENEPPFLDHEAYPVLIEPETADATDEWPFPGFSRTLIGLSKGETKTLTYTYPEDYKEELDEGQTSLKGKTIHYEVHVTRVSLRTVPDLDEKFLDEVGPYASVEELREKTREHLATHTQERYDEEYAEQVLDALVKASEFKYPPEAVSNEIDLLYDRMKRSVERQGFEMEVFLKTIQTDEASYREKLRPSAEDRLKQSLVLLEVAKKENIEVNQDDVNRQLEQTVNSLLLRMSEREAQRALTDDALRGIAANIFNNALLDQALTHLREIAQGAKENPPPNGEPANEANEDIEAASESSESAEEPAARPPEAAE